MPLAVTEDTPPDMLAGAMDIKVVLPNGRTVNMSVDRSTPMMDLLVQLTTAHKLSLAGHMTVALSESGARLHHLPSTPVGALDTRLLHVTPRNNTTLKRAPLRPNNAQPFQTTFRLQVHLPRNQLFVTRVSPDTCLADILHQACVEKNLDPAKYELRHPANLQEKLSLGHTLGDYHLQEVTMVAARPMGSPLTPADIMALQKEEEKRRQQVKASGSAYNIVFNKRSSTNVTGSVSSDSLNGRSISPARSDESANRSISPPAPMPPQRPGRKRRPAPKPPAPAPTAVVKQESMTSHSRTSSDSSGYHEASVLSETNETRTAGDVSADSLPRRSKLPSNPPAVRQKASTLENGGSSNNASLSRSLSNLTSQVGMSGAHSVSTTSLSSQGHRKKKAAPPPPVAPARKQAQPAPAVVVDNKVPTAPTTAINSAGSKTTVVDVKPEAGNVVVTVVSKAPVEVKMQKNEMLNVVDKPEVENRVQEQPVQEISRPVEKISQPVEEISQPVKEIPQPVQEVAQPIKETLPSIQEIAKQIEKEVSTTVQINTKLDDKPKEELKVSEDKPAIASPVPVAKASVTQVPTSQNADLTKPVPQPRPRLLAKPQPQPRKAKAPTIAPRHVTPPSTDSNLPDTVEQCATEKVPSLDEPLFSKEDVFVEEENRQGSRKSSGFDSVGQAFGRGKTLLVMSMDDDCTKDEKPTTARLISEEFDIKVPDLELFDVPTESQTQKDFYSGPNRFSEIDFEVSNHYANSGDSSSSDELFDTKLTDNSNQQKSIPKAYSDAVIMMPSVSSDTSLRSLDEKGTMKLGEASLTRWSSLENLNQSPAWRLGSQDTESDVISDRERCLSSELESSEWEYHLPAPPSAFRDLESPTLTEFGTVALEDSPVFQEPPAEVRKPSVERATVGSKSSRANDFDDSWEPQKLAFDMVVKNPTPKFVNGDLRLREDGVTKEVFKVNPLFNAQQYEDEVVVRKVPAKYAPAESEIIEKSKTLVSRSISNDLQTSNHLRNFTISAYEKPQNVDTNRTVGDDFKKPLPPKSQTLARTNSYTSTDVPRSQPPTVKRSTSYVALARPYSRPTSFQSINRTKSISSLVEEYSNDGELRKSNSEVNVNRVAAEEEPMLASLKVLKSILSQSQSALDEANQKHEESEVSEPVSQETEVKDSVSQHTVVEKPPAPVEDVPDLPAKITTAEQPDTKVKDPVTPEPKPFVYLGPPAINFGSWSERPKVQVSIKSDRDYRFGGQSASQNSAGAAQKNISTPQNNPNSPVNRFKNAIAKNSLPADYAVVEAKPAKIDPTPLTMRIVTHTTTSIISQDQSSSRPAESRQMEPVIKVEKDEVDNSRLPIVRSVELKKTVPESFVQLRNRSSTHLNGGGNNVAQVSINNYQSNINNRHSYVDGELPSYVMKKSMSSSQLEPSNKLINMNKRYTSVVGINGGSVNTLPRPVSKPDLIPGKPSVYNGPKPMPTVKGFRMPGGDTANTVIREEQPIKSTPVVENKPVNFTNKVTEEKSNALRGQPLKTINGAENVRTVPTWAQHNEKFANLYAEPVKVIKFKKPVQRPLEKRFTNPRDALMDAIKNFGGQDALKEKNETRD